MSVVEEVKLRKLPLKVMINKEKTKVLFVEADSQFADVLFSFLTLPLGKIVRILEKNHGEKAPVFGSLTTLYKGVENLDCICGLQRSYLLNPTKSQFFNLRPHVEDTESERRDDRDGKRKRPQVSKALVTRASKAQSQAQAVADDGDDDGDGGGVFALSTASFIISDDLRIAPVVPGAIIQSLMSVGVTDTEGAELRMVTFEYNEIKDLLRVSLVSQTPLTDIIIRKRSQANCVMGNLLHQMERALLLSNSKKMIVKAMLQKSTNKLLIAEAEENFIDFLFSFLTMPLGGVESLFNGKTCLKNIDNLYRSIANINGDKYLNTKDTKTMLLTPKLSNCHTSQNQSLFVVEGLSPYHQSLFTITRNVGNYVKGPVMYNVTDDLTVTPFSLTSCVSIVNGLKIPLYDIKEVDLHVGVEEALSILKASLTSTSALTNGLVNPLLKKQPKQEH